MSTEKSNDHFIFSIDDDGAGINLDNVAAKAIEKGLYSEEQVAKMNDNELAQIIFQPGFSTSKTVSQISGRGEGMDMVKETVDSVGGCLEIETDLGKGASIKISFPRSQSIIYF